VILTYRYRLLPLKSQHRALERFLHAQRELYNAALEERIDCYRKTGKTRTYIDQCKALTECRRECLEMSELPVTLQRWTLKRLEAAFQGFFRRMKTRRGKAGFPRFRNKRRWEAFGFNEFSGIRFDGKRLRFAGMPGGLKVHLHRELPEDASIRSCVFRQDGSGWFVCLQIAVPTPEKRVIGSVIGVDLGLEVFAYCSDNVPIPNPRIARRAEKELRRRQRALSRCQRGSHRRHKVRTQVAGVHRKITDTRNSWLNKEAAGLVKRADLIVVEDLKVANMIRHPTFARSIADASWSRFVSMLAYKVEKTGGHLTRVDPRNTSQECSRCHKLVPKSLAVRTHQCPSCGLAIHRDYNASLNIRRAGIGARALNVIESDERAPENICLLPRGSEAYKSSI
jgi:putative transposase